jgi:hypothetical protein
MQDQQFTLPFPPLQVRAGVLVVDGYGITTRVLYGKLRIEDGIGPHRRSIALDRTGSGLERLVLLGKSGTVTLESLAWLRAIGASFVHLGLDGDVLTHSAPFGYEGQPVRRAQALAVANGLAAGTDPRTSPHANRQRASAIAEGHRRNREWTRENRAEPRDEAWLRSELLPSLDAFSLRELADATHLSLTACSRVRAGLKVPHRRHWEALVRLARQQRAPRTRSDLI